MQKDPKVFAEAVRDGKVPGFTIDPDNPIFKHEWMPIDAPAGTVVVYTGLNGYDGDKVHANNHLEPGQRLTVKSITVHAWSSTVEFYEVPGVPFNTVHFAIPAPNPTAGAHRPPAES